jgi:hypothetical protein
MSAAPIVIIITRPKKQHEKIGESEQIQVLADENDTTADILRKALEQLEG